MDLTALQSAVSDLKSAVDKIAPANAGASDDQAAVDALTQEVTQLVDELTGSPGASDTLGSAPASTSIASTSTSTDAPSASSDAPAAAATGVGAWTPPGS